MQAAEGQIKPTGSLGQSIRQWQDRGREAIPRIAVESGIVDCMGIVIPRRRRPIGSRDMKWAYGMTTVPSRRYDLFPRTLRSLTTAGFPQPRLFVDGVQDARLYEELGLEVTAHNPTIRTFGNWCLALAELWLRHPESDRFALFQDDFVTYPNLRSYLEQTEYPAKSYLNLYTFPVNQHICPVENGVAKKGFYPSNQRGKGAVALIFDRDAVRTLLAHSHMIDRPLDPKRGWKAIDGGIVTAMRKAGYTEYVHNPSLVQHTGDHSSMGNRRHVLAESFRGEAYDCLNLLRTDEQTQA